MPTPSSKQVSGFHAALQVQSGDKIGFGTGSTAEWFIQGVAHRSKMGELKDIVGIATSNKSFDLCKQLGIPMIQREDIPKEVNRLTFTCDGADRWATSGKLIKGGGGAHMIEKMVAVSCIQNGGQYVIIVDNEKLTAEELLGTNFDIPVEVDVFALHRVKATLESQSQVVEKVTIRPSVKSDPSSPPFQTDRNNLILDVKLVQSGKFPSDFVLGIKRLSGVIEIGLFDDEAKPTGVLVGQDDSTVVEYRWDVTAASFVAKEKPHKVTMPDKLLA